jgi:hypothetical protein
MTELLTRPVAWMVQQAATFPDTVVMKTVTVQRGWFETVTGIASGVMTLTLLGLTIFLAPAAWSFWRTFRKVRDLLDTVYADVMPIAKHGHNIADNLDYITTSIRSDVQQVNATIAFANRRLQQAAEVTENRLNEFNALLQVVQQEAEQAFVSTAAAVRGVRTGAAALGGLDDRDDRDNFYDEELVSGGIDDGDDNESHESADSEERIDSGEGLGDGRASAHPRLRSRRRRQV